jgi:hypothetical protein
MTLYRASSPEGGARRFPIDDATQRRKDRGRRQSMWVVCRSNTYPLASGEVMASVPLLVCASHGVACKKLREMRKVSPGDTYRVVEVPLMKVYQ